MTVKLYDPLQTLPASVRPGGLAGKAGLRRVEDLLYWFPRTMRTGSACTRWASAPAGEKCCVAAESLSRPAQPDPDRDGDDLGFGRRMTPGSSPHLFHQSYVRSALRPASATCFTARGGAGPRKTMVNPLTGRGRAIRPAALCRSTGTEGSQRLAGRGSGTGLTDCVDQIPEDLPPGVRSRYHLAQAGWAVPSVHFPASWEELELARRRLVFEELFYFSAGLELLLRRDGFRRVLPA